MLKNFRLQIFINNQKFTIKFEAINIKSIFSREFREFLLAVYKENYIENISINFLNNYFLKISKNKIYLSF